MGKIPGFTFYPGDWLRDHISGCSLAAQGLWLRMMILAHDSDRYGYLTIANGTPMPPETISRRVGVPLDQYVTLLAELDEAGVPSRTPEGIIYSRRMARDNKLRQQTKLRVRKHRKRNGAVTHSVTPLYEDENESIKEVDFDVGFRKFLKPSLEEVTEYVHARGDLISPEAFYDFYESVGWKIGNKPMKKWKNAIGTWERRISGQGNGKPTYETAQERRSRNNDAAIIAAMRSRVIARTESNGEDVGHGSGPAGGGGVDEGVRERQPGSGQMVLSPMAQRERNAPNPSRNTKVGA